MIEIIPAIDIIDGKCVRLTRGDYNTQKAYGDPIAMAQEFEQMGFHRLHVVDLDGAKTHHLVNLPILKAITASTQMVVDYGGGVRTTEDVDRILEAGASMVSVGSIAVSAPELYNEWMNTYGASRLILCADTRNGFVSLNGWQDDSTTPLSLFLKQYITSGTRNVLVTDISRDGTLQGPATQLYAKVMESYPECHLIASGGVSSMEDIDALERAGVPAVVVGKAIYEGTIDINRLKDQLCSQSE